MQNSDSGSDIQDGRGGCSAGETGCVSAPENKKPARDEKGRLLPGNTANPGGRPRTAKLYREWLDAVDERIGIDRRRALWQRAYNIAIGGKDSDSTTALRLMFEYDMGRPAQMISSEDGKPVSIGVVVLPLEESE